MPSCFFIGHSDCDRSVKDAIYEKAEKLILYDNVNVFYVGTHGHFDFYAYKALCELRKIYDIKVYVVLAYINQSTEYTYYSQEDTVYPSTLENTPLRYAINKRNMYMLSKSEYLICLLNNTFSNTYTFVKKAKNKKLSIINIGKCNLDNI